MNMPLDYFVWAIVGQNRTFLVDTGFDAEVANQRGRTITHAVARGLNAIGIAPQSIEDVIVTHMHYDHAGNSDLFPNARFHVQDLEMSFCTGRCMCHGVLSHPFHVEDVKSMVGRVFAGRVVFHNGESTLAPGLSLHLVGGHTGGLQVVRIHTARGWVVLASDASHLYANIEDGRPFPGIYNLADMLEGYRTVNRLADSPAHVIPGHDPAVLEKYPSANHETNGWIVRVDLEPR
ncbi:glyoxylase-like metal-dependent hydrolase (beta-lactamase superfamily II) [Paraburkholderia unamae]|nr:glyoxylase-like metal-dependent hydrolase (beta-lactamase superfamily II) [Paraburkholderia unamae]